MTSYSSELKYFFSGLIALILFNFLWLKGMEEITLIPVIQNNNNNNNLTESPPLIHKASPSGGMTPEEHLLCDAAHGMARMDLIEKGASVNARLGDGRTLLMCAAEGGLVDFCAQLIDMGADVHATDDKGYTALMYSYDWYQTVEESIKLCELFTKAGIDINARSENGKSALIMAVERNKPEIVAWLIQHGADLNILDNENNNALLCALEKGYEEISKILIEAGINVNMQNNRVIFRHTQRDTALSLAVEKQLVSIVKLLLEHGALVDIRDGDDKTALMKAVQKRNVELCQLLLAWGAGANDVGSEGYTPLAYTAGFPSPTFSCKAARVLFSAGAVFRKNGARNPLCIAAEQGNLAVCDLFVQQAGMGIVNSREKVGNGNSYTPLHLAALNGHKSVVEFLLARGADTLLATCFGDTALMLAAQGGFDQIVKLLLDVEKNVHARNSDGETALTLAAAVGSVETGKLLLAAGAEVSSKNNDGFSALVVAVSKGHKEFIDLLLAAGASLAELPQEYDFLVDAAQKGLAQVCRFLITQRKIPVDKPDESGKTAIMVASDLQTIETLLDLGADINAKCCWGGDHVFSLLHAAIYHGTDPRICSLLVKRGLGVDTRDSHDNTPLLTAVLCGKPSFCENLIASGADFEAICGLRGTSGCLNPLLAAILGEKEDLFLMLTRAGASPDRAFFLAAECGHLDACKYLLEKDVRVNARDEKGLTALHYAYQTKNNELITFLVSRGANCNAIDDGYTALHRAVLNGQHDEITKLLATGIDCNAKTSAGDTALHLAVQKREVAMVKQLLEAKNILVDEQSAFKKTPLHCAVVLTHYFHIIPSIESVVEIVKLLIAHGADLSAENQLHETPLMCAVGHSSCKPVVELLLSQGLDVNAINKWSGRTPLHEAAHCLNSDIIELLLSKGANSNARDRELSTPLHLATASRASNGKYKEVVELLLSGGADPTAKNVCADTPLHSAAEQGEKPEVVALLLARGADAKALNREGHTPLELAKYGGDHIITLLRASLCTICDTPLMAQKDSLVPISDACEHRIHKVCREALVDDANFKGECPICQAPIKQDVEECFFCFDEFDPDVDNGVLVGKNCTHRIHAACREKGLQSFKGKCPQCTAVIDNEKPGEASNNNSNNDNEG